jgi:hypothetical protein
VCRADSWEEDNEPYHEVGQLRALNSGHDLLSGPAQLLEVVIFLGFMILEL